MPHVIKEYLFYDYRNVVRLMVVVSAIILCWWKKAMEMYAWPLSRFQENQNNDSKNKHLISAYFFLVLLCRDFILILISAK